MKKLLVRLVVLLIVLVVILVLARNVIVPPIVSSGVKSSTGLRVDIGAMDIGLLKRYVDVQRLQLMNPPGFTDPVMVDIPQISVAYQLGPLLRNRLHLPSVTFAMQEVMIVKNADGALNIDALKALQGKRPPGSGQPPREDGTRMDLQIDELAIRVGKVVFKDYSGGGAPRVQEFSLNLDERFSNVTSPNDVTMALVMRILTRTGIAGLANIDLNALQGTAMQQAADIASEIVSGVATNLGGETGKALQDAADALKRSLPFGR